MNITRLTQDQARAAYALLVAHAGARADKNDEADFVREFTRSKPTSEYRFMGKLGMGGKFRFPRMTVDGYPEDMTPAREAMIAATNQALAKLAALMALQQNPTGYFVDEDGNTCEVASPGRGRTCSVVVCLLESDPYLGVDVAGEDGFVVHEATYYPTLDALRAVGVTIQMATS